MKKLFVLGYLILCTNVLFAQTATIPSAGDGSEGNPYQIATLENLYWITADVSRRGYHYIQTEDIDATTTSSWDAGAGWTPIANNNNTFTGSYDGQNHIIDNLYINRGSTICIGLFGYTYGANVDNVGLTNTEITGERYVGGLIGWNQNSTLSNSYSSGSVTGNGQCVGGLVGYSDYYSTISNCYSSGSITGNTYTVGGLVGQSTSFSTINNCYSAGSVTGSYNIGGLVGENDNATVSNSYSSGSVSGTGGGLVGFHGWDDNSIVSNSFWDTETSGKYGSDGGTGKTTAEMKTQSTFTDSGWNFQTVWDISTTINNGYPYLKEVLPVGIAEKKSPITYILDHNYPNPFNPTTAISYQLSADSNVELSVFDMNGRKIATLVNENKNTGYHTVNWDASGFSSGIYFYQLTTGDFIDTKKMVFVK